MPSISSSSGISKASSEMRIDGASVGHNSTLDDVAAVVSDSESLKRVGGTIGTVLFVQIGSALAHGGPGNLVLAFVLWSTFIVAVNNCLVEMVTWMPISSPFVRYAEHFVDPALGFCAGINFFLLEALCIPFETTAFNLVLHFWTDKIPVEAVIVFLLGSYVLLNCFAIQYYGESEFWLAIGKILLIIGLTLFTVVTMCGGNPIHDAYGFRNWDPSASKVPGTPFAPYLKPGAAGHFIGFVACLIQASFTIVGPEYIAMTAGEAKAPRTTMPRAFNSIIWRMMAFFIIGAICVGTVVAYSDRDLIDALSDAHPGAAASPYVIAMIRMHIPVLPHIVNALIATSIFSAGNSYMFCASRTLYGLALEGKAPAFMKRCTARGVPVYCVGATLAVSLFAFLNVSDSASRVLNWSFIPRLQTLLAVATLINYAIISVSYLRFYKALEVNGISRRSLPYRSPWQPFCAYYALFGTVTMAFVDGYMVFLPGHWDITTFIFSYGMIPLCLALYVGWKLLYATKVKAFSYFFHRTDFNG
ncbi:hypothetical protein FISHEDRAFT_67894 [Fistulina hepatica ATCC 64428]|nr:hypothetical protein FISHEDRAFT_67894 [Fistulina hepatica ATCC 64428]